jgi:hypothetical protein
LIYQGVIVDQISKPATPDKVDEWVFDEHMIKHPKDSDVSVL